MAELMLKAQKHMNAEEAVYARRTRDGFDPQAGPSQIGEFSLTDKRRKEAKHQKQTRKEDTSKERRDGAAPRFGPIGEIKVIHGGFAGGGESSHARKAHLRKLRTEEYLKVNTIDRPSKIQKKEEIPIIFSEEDLKGIQIPHDDPLVITIVIANYLTRRVLIDSGSSANILYLHAYDQLKVGRKRLRPMASPLFGFAAYNAILGRTTLNKIEAIISTYHLMIKFPTLEGVACIRGDQKAARECYVTSLRGANITMNIESLDTRDEEKLQHGEPVEELIEELLEPRQSGKTGISHKLNVDPTVRPVKQKKRAIAPERNEAAAKEVDKLIQAESIREVLYPDWLANVVMVKNANGKWRMCVDFTDLNKACPKDSFPLPKIDSLADSTAGHELLSFMDAFSGYNQIQMHEGDQEKTSFITDRGLYCYKVMPFGLKNAGATYQRLVNRMFKQQIGPNVEVYVFDMLVQSAKAHNHVDDLEETFQVLKKYRMKLNSTKCAFGISLGKFLSFMVSQRGIEANPEKIQAILAMRSPRNIKEVQKLTGLVAALSRFISRASDKCQTFFKVLKKAFEWTTTKEIAFTQLKEYLVSPPLLSRTQDGENLFLYLAVSPQAVSTVLVREEQGTQLPVYYTSKALRGAELRYPRVEKIDFAMVLANFLAEYTYPEPEELPKEEPKPWVLQVDGSTTKDASGAGLILTSPKGQRLSYALRFEFKTTNNEAEYEALVVGLELASAVGASHVLAKSDSQLVVGQILGEYTVKEEIMQKYVDKVKAQVAKLQSFNIVRILREENDEADYLAKLATAKEDAIPRNTPVRYLELPSIISPDIEVQAINYSDSWTGPIVDYITNGTLPRDKVKARQLKIRAAKYLMMGDVLYRRSFSLPYLRCLTTMESMQAMEEVHQGICGDH
ncbi:uncharacterized protein LOC131306874 [Rhododendron vialii]|uniref:uncharacterized protein LOC131306874 n=1 Tax=Rhododendron vialii TaxID=182163 RepID=UPI00265E9E9D|nr:uncharacterized protein LOC131306874 [Rhododendron vialii]